ncbi:MAG TPA: ABC transporter ATP-binding protein [Kiritimatiellia bacterium]|nr:ABC transporter ATP-binding protein [Kiritimatiellia bacterium]HMO97657.1 ABC transporter ATP-binding protein [Kiritimatiellia bacterium]HMP95518.1 ABC transporter ATP-binding protein [Kiritimatiellia bacterium]
MNNPDTRQGIWVDAVTKFYQIERTRIEVLRGISLVVSPGESIAIMGASGAGKSTLLHTLGGLDRPTSGRVLLDGEDIYNAPARRRNAIRAREFGFVFQAFHLLPELDVLDNIALPALGQSGALRRREAIRERARGLLEAVGLDHRLGHRPVEMSGGEQQRAAIARALMNRPRYVFADEPTGNLDSRTGESVLETLFRLAAEQAAALVVVTHNREVAERCRTRLVLKDGSLDPHEL